MERKQNGKIAALIAGALFAVSGLTGVANATRIGCGNSFAAYGAAADEAATLQDKNLSIADSTSFDGVRVSITGQVESDAADYAYARRTVLYAGIGEGDRDLSEAESISVKLKFVTANSNRIFIVLADGTGNTAVSKFFVNRPNDGKALFGRDAMANYMIIGAKQLGCDIFETKDGQTTVNLPREVAKRLWDHYYVPYVKGYFSASGRFRSDDMKTGNVLAFVGSSAGCTFFPDHVTRSDEESYPIEVKTYPAPKFEGGGDYAVQQGAGMVVIRKSDEQVEAAARFLKWFTQSDWAIEFSVTSGYLPVTAEDNDMVKIEKDSPSMKKNVRDSLSTAVQVVRQNTLYTSKAFKNGMSARKKLEYAMSDAAKADRQRVVEAIENGATQEAAVAAFVSEEHFDAWYAQLMDELNELAAQ